jgi:hypothetical protein
LQSQIQLLTKENAALNKEKQESITELTEFNKQLVEIQKQYQEQLVRNSDALTDREQ